MAVSQPNVWKVALSMTFLPLSSRNFIHMRTMSPQFGLPTVPTVSAPSISPMFFGLAMASAIFFCRSESMLFKLVARHIRIDFPRPSIDAAAQSSHILKTVPEKISGGIHALFALVIDDDEWRLPRPAAQHFLHEFLRK